MSVPDRPGRNRRRAAAAVDVIATAAPTTTQLHVDPPEAAAKRVSAAQVTQIALASRNDLPKTMLARTFEISHPEAIS
ncbi:hypothetical protein ACFW3D_29885 [Streptomyces sp. NPDC058864]